MAGISRGAPSRASRAPRLPLLALLLLLLLLLLLALLGACAPLRPHAVVWLVATTVTTTVASWRLFARRGAPVPYESGTSGPDGPGPGGMGPGGTGRGGTEPGSVPGRVPYRKAGSPEARGVSHGGDVRLALAPPLPLALSPRPGAEHTGHPLSRWPARAAVRETPSRVPLVATGRRRGRSS